MPSACLDGVVKKVVVNMADLEQRLATLELAEKARAEREANWSRQRSTPASGFQFTPPSSTGQGHMLSRRARKRLQSKAQNGGQQPTKKPKTQESEE